jgi:hypothetical protein
MEELDGWRGSGAEKSTQKDENPSYLEIGCAFFPLASIPGVSGKALLGGWRFGLVGPCYSLMISPFSDCAELCYGHLSLTPPI